MKLTKKQLQNLLIEQVLFSEGLRYHVEHSIPLYDCIYRPGSKGFFSLISESRTMYNNGFLRVDEDELDMLNSDLGEFALYEGREVALDFPISEAADYALMNENIQDIALAYRSYLENNFEFYDHGEGHLNCAWTAAHFKDWANMNSLDPAKVGVFYFVEQPGQNLSHIAPTYDDFIIDPTIRQFDPNELPVRVTHVKDYRSTYQKFGYGQGVVHDYIKDIGIKSDYIYDTIEGLQNRISWKMTIYPPVRKQTNLNESFFNWLSGGSKLSPEQKREKEFLDFHSISIFDSDKRIAYLKNIHPDPREQRKWLDEYNQVWKPNHIRKLLEKKIEQIKQRKLVSTMSAENESMINQLNDLINQLEIAKLSSDIRTIQRIEKQINQLGIMLNEEKKRRKRRKKKKSKAKKSGSYYKGRKVKLNKPQRNSGSGGKFVVYVRNQKTGNIKRITFGARGMTTGLRNPARRKSFAARHRCAQKKDKLAPGYWACRIGRHPKVSGAPYTTWW